MAIALTLPNILQFISFIAPTLLVFFLFLSSLFNQNVKGLVYIAGLLLASMVNIIFMNVIGSERNEGAEISGRHGDDALGHVREQVVHSFLPDAKLAAWLLLVVITLKCLNAR